VGRALRILDALCHAADEAGCSISSISTPAALVVAGVQVPFALIEIQRGVMMVLGQGTGGGQRLWQDKASEQLEDRVADMVGSARLQAQAIEARDRRIADRTAARRAEGLEQAHFSKRLTFITEHADRLVEADKVQRLVEHLRATDDGSSLRLPDILRWADAYVEQLRERCSAANLNREAGDWRIW
jgi:hypothetical protein